MWWRRAAALLLGALSALPAHADAPLHGDAARGRMLVETELCQGCHGETGDSENPLIPKLSGQRAGYLLKQLRDFNAGRRRNAVMSAMATNIADADFIDIAFYFSIQEKMQGEPPEEDAQARNLFLHGDAARGIPACAGCHGSDGGGAADNGVVYPAIGGQHRKYLLGQMVAWSLGERANGPDNVMGSAMKALSAAEMNALSRYISGL